MVAATKRIFRFGNDLVEGDGSMVDTLGGKGAGLAEMTRMSLPVPPGFTISTEVCREFLETGVMPTGLDEELYSALRWLETATGKRLDDPANPLLVSVRSGAAVSMPGMMDTVLNVGLNDRCVPGWMRTHGSVDFVLDSYRRLLQMFGSIVMDIPREVLDQALREVVPDGPDNGDRRLPEKQMLLVVRKLQATIERHAGKSFPQSPYQQITMAIPAVFHSWDSERAVFYRRLNHVPDGLGTAVTIQAMVFGNSGNDSGTGVGFTRNPSTGSREVFGEYLPDAQGEDIVAGTCTPMPLRALATMLPALHEELSTLAERLERHYRDTQEFEFTVESGRLFLLQVRAAKRTALAAVTIAVDMAEEGLIDKGKAIARVRAGSIVDILLPALQVAPGVPVLVQGLAASPGAATGKIALSSEYAVAMASRGDSVILVREETTADDIQGMVAAKGFLTARGGATSHAAVVARGMGKCCITGARDIEIDATNSTARIGKQMFREGDWLALDGSSGRVFSGNLPLATGDANNAALDKLLLWSTQFTAAHVLANADTPEDAISARASRAGGIGLCRTEHMFFEPTRLKLMRSMILAADMAERVRTLDALLPMQQADFEELFRTMSPLPVTIRLLDPPLHEFLPSLNEIREQSVAARQDEHWEEAIELDHVRRRIEQLTETNPMMGHRGCRLSLTSPEIMAMQVRAILQAALAVAAQGHAVTPGIMVPLVASEEEMSVLARMIRETADEVFLEAKSEIPYSIGAMIELPRAAIQAARIARHVSFVSFGTNDLTQMTYGFSRDDAGNYLNFYLRQGIFRFDPFKTIDREGVGRLLDIAIRQLRSVDPMIKVGVCGEHAGDPESIEFFCSLGVDYLSCSPSRLPIAHLAMAQALQRPAQIIRSAGAVDRKLATTKHRPNTKRAKR